MPRSSWGRSISPTASRIGPWSITAHSRPRREHLGPGHLYALWSAVNLAEGLSHLGRFDELIAEIDRMFAVLPFSSAPFDHPGVQASVRVFAGIYKRAGRPAEATRLYREALAAVEARNGPLHQAAWQYRHLCSPGSWSMPGNRTRRSPLFQANLPIDARGGRGMMTREALAQVLADAGRLDEALALRQERARQRAGSPRRRAPGLADREDPGGDRPENPPASQEVSRGRAVPRRGLPRTARPPETGAPGYDWKLLADARGWLIELYQATDRPGGGPTAGRRSHRGARKRPCTRPGEARRQS